MEDSSHELIEQMIAEEKYCYGFDSTTPVTAVDINPSSQEPHLSYTPENTTQTIANKSDVKYRFESVYNMKISEPPTMTKQNVLVEPKKEKDHHISKGSSANLPSHNQRWTLEEDRLLKEALELFGYGHWQAISGHVRTRNILQCKNRARQKHTGVSQQRKQLSVLLFQSTATKQEENTTSIKEPRLESAADAYKTPMTTPPLSSSDISNDNIESIEPQNPIDNNSLPLQQSNDDRQLPIQEEPVTEIDNTAKNVGISQTKDTTQEEQKTNEESEGSLQKEFQINLEEISEDEYSKNTEWFLGKPAKTPQRYMRIRNHIISCWQSSKPNYLTKTAGRKNLTDCGDVNAVGRIHAYLESIHAINVNCTSPVKRSYERSTRSENGSPNKKKVKKTPGYFWADIDEDEEKKTQISNIIEGDRKSRPRRAAKKPETFYNESNESGHGHNPFTLVPVSFYSSDKSAPFTVSITSEALLVMDFHAHLAYTEIIGLLGGRVVQNETGLQELKVEYVFPCRSTSTGIQCEMDPVSEMAARELFEQKGLSVVGWYHSHPTFEPEPSIRDIENQTSYQDLFRDESSGLEPFIGVIITPYNSNNIAVDKSQIRIIHISKRWSPKNEFRIPFACLHKVIPSKTISRETVDLLKNLIFEYKEYEHKIDMTLQYGQILRLDKLINTMRNHLFIDQGDAVRFLTDMRYMIQNSYNKEEKRGSSNEQQIMISQEPIQNQMDNVIDSLAVSLHQHRNH